ncbi:SDR family NAD(P)-dependent oxidoreductase [Streptomyces leeuwenhoekii]|jgi:ketoreductase|uniref:SDR family NAD(P)-dependent oxidoreductase n=1 Tax=Streptomyces leeuwenhoekii TaxID=1437453 RepID=UPI0013DC2569|nr:SDR family NAD(P)-dependent oxidoreductase [Streptomyces harenosi]NEY31643.1 SDR family NAD(P)-dependent oxidoreductase [Streptomyces harenosi]
MPAPTASPSVALVTGGTSGIGLAIAQALLQDGFKVVVTGRDTGKLDTVLRSLKMENDRFDVAGYACDVRDRAAVRTMVEQCVTEHGEPRILVNNAGRSGGGVTAAIPDELWLDVIETNLNSVFWVTREVIRASEAIKQPAGRIINIASTGGKQGVPYGAPYSAAKAGVIGFTKALAKEFAQAGGPTVNAVCPGYVETPMARDIRAGYAKLNGVSEEEVLAEFEAKIPLGRYCTPEEVAGMVRYLAGPAAASVTAQALNVCGGLGSY